MRRNPRIPKCRGDVGCRRVAGSRRLWRSWQSPQPGSAGVRMPSPPRRSTSDGEQVRPDDVPEAERPFVRFVRALEEAEASYEVSLGKCR